MMRVNDQDPGGAPGDALQNFAPDLHSGTATATDDDLRADEDVNDSSNTRYNETEEMHHEIYHKSKKIKKLALPKPNLI